MQTNAGAKKKSLAPWIILLVLPYILLMTTAMIQIGARFVLAKTESPSVSTCDADPRMQIPPEGEVQSSPPVDGACQSSPASVTNPVVNIVSLLIGIAAVLMILGTPLWIVFLIMAYNYNQKLSHGGSQPPVPPQHV